MRAVAAGIFEPMTLDDGATCPLDACGRRAAAFAEPRLVGFTAGFAVAFTTEIAAGFAAGFVAGLAAGRWTAFDAGVRTAEEPFGAETRREVEAVPCLVESAGLRLGVAV
ncbi:hypothetical protein B5F33_06475 [Collinsella sp. An2]|nr:hypothetical protein B5F33_06475 [Collinsella sp. An2]